MNADFWIGVFIGFGVGGFTGIGIIIGLLSMSSVDKEPK